MMCTAEDLRNSRNLTLYCVKIMFLCCLAAGSSGNMVSYTVDVHLRVSIEARVWLQVLQF